MSDALRRPPLRASGAAPSAATSPSPRRLPSDLLFGGRQEIEIEHRLQVHRMRLTAAGKPRKIVSNLVRLREHPGLGKPMRGVAAKLQRHWSTVVGAEATQQGLH